MKTELEWLRGLEQAVQAYQDNLGDGPTALQALRRRINRRIIEVLEAEQVMDEYMAQQFECDGTNCPPRAHDHRVAHASYCGLPSTHEGVCQAVVTRLLDGSCDQ